MKDCEVVAIATVHQAFNKKEVSIVKNTHQEIHHFVLPFDDWVRENYYLDQNLDSRTMMISEESQAPEDIEIERNIIKFTEDQKSKKRMKTMF